MPPYPPSATRPVLAGWSVGLSSMARLGSVLGIVVRRPCRVSPTTASSLSDFDSSYLPILPVPTPAYSLAIWPRDTRGPCLPMVSGQPTGDCWMVWQA